MKFEPEKHHRQSIRLRNYDYSQPGYYFLTICTHKKQCWLGEIKNDRMYLNQIGKIFAEEWLNTPKIRPNFQLDEWVIMPNHLHGIVIINENLNLLGDRNVSEQKTFAEGNMKISGALRPYGRNQILFRHLWWGLNRLLRNGLIC